jgi:WD40 repeat protein
VPLLLQVVVYQVLTGRLHWVLGTHDALVYSISWSQDDSAIITASADYTAKIWHLPALPVPYGGSSGAVYGTAAGLASMWGGSSTFGSTAAVVGAAASAGVTCVVLQHHCFVYAAETHPQVAPVMVAITGGFDGTLRMWDACHGLVLSAVQVMHLRATTPMCIVMLRAVGLPY